MTTPARELARRVSGLDDEVLLLWHPETDRLELAIRDLMTGVSLHLDVAAASALDAFYHPYVFIAGGESSARGTVAAGVPCGDG
jgi:hypothetical protein